MTASPSSIRPSITRLGRLTLATVLLGAVLALVPRPAFAIEWGVRVDDETPVLDLVPADVAPASPTEQVHGHSDEATGDPDDDQADASAAAPDRLHGGSTGIDEFEMIGVTFAAADTESGQVRVSVDGEWSEWEPLTNVDGDHGPDTGSAEAESAQPASDPIWVGDGDGYELDLPADATGVEVHLVRETEERVVVDATPDAGAYQMPSVLPRSSWGARSPKDPTEFASTVNRAIIHHTVNANGYSSGSVPGMLRSIQAYHMDSNGWSDIGYNFVVDRFGRTWEGRNLSTYEAVIGAHAKDSNTATTGVAFLGDGTASSLPSAAHEAISTLIAWKLPLHGTFFSGSEIVGHRDVFATSCPGDAIWNQLGSIRTRSRALRPPAGPFLDVPDTAWNSGEITWGKLLGISTGYEDGNFRPAESLSRAQLVNMLWGLVGEPRSNVRHGFTDVPRASWLTPALDWAKEAGVITGYGDGTFRGDDNVRRDAIAVLLWRWATEPVGPVPHGFSDVPGSSWADEALDWAKGTGVVNGFRNGTYQPASPVKRGQILPMLYSLRPFVDVPATAWYHDGAHWGLHQQVALGFADRTFRGTQGVNRAQGTSMLWRMMDAPTTPAPPDHAWPDVAGDAWFDAALDWATAAGWVDGKPDGDFHADDAMIRSTVVQWIWQTAGSPAATTSHPFTDVPGGAPYDAALDWAAEHGVFNGFGDEFRPDDEVNRAQFIMALHRLATTPAAWTGGATPPTTTLF